MCLNILLIFHQFLDESNLDEREDVLPNTKGANRFVHEWRGRKQISKSLNKLGKVKFDAEGNPITTAKRN